MASAAQAATYNVTTTTDDQPASAADCPADATSPGCSLREAVYAANDNPSGDTINVPAGEYVLTNELDDSDNDADLDIRALNDANDAAAGALTIVGASARNTVIRSKGQVSGSFVYSRIFDIEGGTSFDPGTGCQDFPGPVVEMRNLKISDGVDDDFDDGGGIRVLDGGSNCAGDDASTTDARLTVRDSAIVNNSTPSEGGGIYNESEVVLINTLVAGNDANDEGGGIYSEDSVTLTNSTIGGNQADGDGGGIRAFAFSIEQVGNGGDEDTGIVDSTNSTIVYNESDGVGGGFAGSGFFGPGPTLLNIRNTIIAHNKTLDDQGSNCFRPSNTVSFGNNLEDQDTCGLDAAGDLPNTDPSLGARRDNGGPTDTYGLETGSQAIDAGTNTNCPSTDQRGVTRPQGARCDIGAYEAPPAPPAPPPPAPATQIVTVNVPTAFDRVPPRRVTARVRKTRPRPGAVRLRTRGRVVLPAGMTAAEGCRFGTISVQVKSGKLTVSNRLTEIRRDCTYRSRVTFTLPRRLANRRLYVTVRFRGNDRLTARRAPRVNAGRP